MKNIFLGLLSLLAVQFASAQDAGLYWKYKDYDGAIAVTVPRFAVHIGSWFLEERADRKFVQKLGKVRVLLFEDGSPVTERDNRRFARKAKRRGLEELIVVRDGQTHIRVMAKERNNGKGIRKVVVFVNSPEGFALVSVRGRLRYDDLSRILQEYGGKKNPSDNPSTDPGVIKVPVSRV